MTSLSNEAVYLPVHQAAPWGMPAAMLSVSGTLPQWLRNIQNDVEAMSDEVLQGVGKVTRFFLTAENTTHRVNNGHHEILAMDSTKTVRAFSSPTLCNFLDEANFVRILHRLSLVPEDQRCKWVFTLQATSPEWTKGSKIEFSFCNHSQSEVAPEEKKGNGVVYNALQSSSSNSLSSSSMPVPAHEEVAENPEQVAPEADEVALQSPAHSEHAVDEAVPEEVAPEADEVALQSPAHSEHGVDEAEPEEEVQSSESSNSDLEGSMDELAGMEVEDNAIPPVIVMSQDDVKSLSEKS